MRRASARGPEEAASRSAEPGAKDRRGAATQPARIRKRPRPLKRQADGPCMGAPQARSRPCSREAERTDNASST
eukprot:8601718-Alexandrium_andersonii.AAC.1